MIVQSNSNPEKCTEEEMHGKISYKFIVNCIDPERVHIIQVYTRTRFEIQDKLYEA